jgi:glycosyltransferase involved in cell wall biosynthesis
MKILVIGHSLIVDSNRKFWSVMANTQNAEVTIISPLEWRSNLVTHIKFKPNMDTDQKIVSCPVPVYFKGNGSLYFYHLIKFYKILNSTKFDAIVVTQETWSLSAFQVGIFKKFTKNRSTAAYLSVCQNIKKSKLAFVQPFERLVSSFYKKIFYCDSSICEVLSWKKIATKTAYWPFSYDDGLYEKKPYEQKSLLRIGYIGRLSEEKGLRNLLEAFFELQKEMSVELVVAGNGPLKDLMLAPGITFLGIIPHNKAHLFYGDIDLLVLPSKTTSFWKEQFGRVIIEAIASGKPVIGSNSGAIPEVLSHIGLNSLFIEGDSVSLTKQIRKMWHRMNSESWTDELETFYQNNKKFSHTSVANSLFHEIQN